MDYKTMLIYAGIFIVFLILMKLMNNLIRKPRGHKVTVSARVVRKERGPEKDENGNDRLYVIFHKMPEREELRLHVRTRVFRELPETGGGSLTYSGDEFLSFDCEGKLIEK